jgi:hypothetical protein
VIAVQDRDGTENLAGNGYWGTHEQACSFAEDLIGADALSRAGVDRATIEAEFGVQTSIF